MKQTQFVKTSYLGLAFPMQPFTKETGLQHWDEKNTLKEGEDEQNYCVNVNNLLCKVESQSSCPFPVSGQPELPELIEIFEAVAIMEKDGGQFSTSFETRERAGARYCRERAIGRFVHPLQGPVSSSIKTEPDPSFEPVSSFGRVTRYEHLGWDGKTSTAEFLPAVERV